MTDTTDHIRAIRARGRSDLAAHRLSALLASPDLPWKVKLSCFPWLGFWVLGFADAMAYLIDDEAEGQGADAVRVHALEDAEHWRWFLQDLKQLEEAGVLLPENGTSLGTQWMPAARPVRAMVYEVMSALRHARQATVRMIALEVCEDGYAAFEGAMTPVVEGAGLFQGLHYLGQTHTAAEAAHEGHQHKEVWPPEGWEDLTSEQQRDACALAEHLYTCLDAMHGVFADAIEASAERV